MAFGKKDKKNKKDEKLIEGLTFNEIKNAGKKPLAMNDIAWAGRLYSKFDTIFEDTTRAIVAMLVISAICIVLIWVSVFMRTPALLLGVYPSGQVVCYPKLVTLDGKQAVLHKSYREMCNDLEAKISSSWQIENSDIDSDNSAVGMAGEKAEYKTVDEIMGEKAPESI